MARHFTEMANQNQLLSGHWATQLPIFILNSALCSSDHCPLLFSLEGSSRTGNLTEKAKDQEQTPRFKWNKDKKEALHDLMRTEEVQKAANELKRSFDLEGVSVDENAAQFTNLIRDAALRSGAAVYHHDRQSQGKKHFPQNAWFDEDCKK